MSTIGGENRITWLMAGEHKLALEEFEDYGETFREKAYNELRENEEVREKALEELKNILKEDDKLIVPADDKYLLTFLRSCKFYPESAYAKMVKMYTFREKNTKYCKNLKPSEDKEAFQNDLLSVLPYRDQHGRRILLIEAGKKWNTKVVSITHIIRSVLLIIEAALLEPKTQIAGADVLIDLDGLSLTHVWQFTPGIAKLILDYIQECAPIRIKSVHIINQPYVFNMLFAIFKPFIGEKLRNRIFFHGENYASLLEHIDSKVVPTQYGGEMVVEFNYGKEFHKLLCQFEPEFEERNAMGLKSKKK